jgi:hypothetical protein
MPPNTQKHRQNAMHQVYVSDEGDDKNDGLSPEAPVKSLKRLCVLWSGRQLVLMEGRETFNRLVDEMVVFVRFAKAELKNEKRVLEAPKPETSTGL